LSIRPSCRRLRLPPEGALGHGRLLLASGPCASLPDGARLLRQGPQRADRALIGGFEALHARLVLDQGRGREDRIEARLAVPVHDGSAGLVRPHGGFSGLLEMKDAVADPDRDRARRIVRLHEGDQPAGEAAFEGR
jgi:hypothetical protein